MKVSKSCWDFLENIEVASEIICINTTDFAHQSCGGILRKIEMFMEQ